MPGIQFEKCKGFFCLDLWVVTHAKTGGGGGGMTLGSTEVR